jgi:hypothetical protein
MSGMLWRVIQAVVVVVILFLLLPPLFSLFGLPLEGALLQVLRICIGGIAVLYVLRGDHPLG